MNNTGVPAVVTAINLLNEIAKRSETTSSSALARRVGASQPTTYRILKTLEAADWIKSVQNSGYQLSMGLLPIAKHFQDFGRYAQTLQGYFESLARELDLLVKLTVRQDMTQCIVCTAEPLKEFTVAVPLGGVYPVVWGSPGAPLLSNETEARLEAIMASIPKNEWKHEDPENVRRRYRSVRENGLSESIGEHPLGIDSISTPVGLPEGMAAITFVGLRGEITDKNLPRLRERIVSAARQSEILLKDI